MFTFILFQTPFATCRFMITSISDILQDIQKGERVVAIKHFVTETSFSLMYIEYNSYYMADRRDTKYLLSIEKYFTSLPGSLVKYFSIQKEKLHISKWSCNVLFIIETPMKYQAISLLINIFCTFFKNYLDRGWNLLCCHNNSDLFTCEDKVLFLHLKMSCFDVKAHLVFHWRNNVHFILEAQFVSLSQEIDCNIFKQKATFNTSCVYF